MRYVPKDVPDDVNVGRTNPLGEFLLLAAAFVVLAVSGFWLLGRCADWLAGRMSPRLEAAIGARFDFGGTDAPALAAERALLDRLLAHAPHSPVPFRLQVVCTGDAVNAIAVPGGRIVVLHGLLTTVRSENELAFVLAHELGHFFHRDHLRAFGRGLLWMALLTTLGAGGDFASQLVEQSGALVASRFSQSQELAADAFAAELLQATYGHVGGATDFFTRPAVADGGGWLGTHPGTDKRVTRFEALAAKRGWPTGAVQPYTPPADACRDGASVPAP